MSAASPPPTGPAPVPPSGTAPHVEQHPPGHPHHGKTAAELAALEVQDNALYRSLKSNWAKLKQGKLIPSKVLAVVVLLVVAGGLWWWFSGQSTRTDSHRWMTLQTLSSSEKLSNFANENPGTVANLVARRSRALILLTMEGTEKLKSQTQAERKKAIANIETARDELAELAGLFKRDMTLKSKCYIDAAVAERSLVGVPKSGIANNDPANSIGSIDRVVEFYKQAAAAIGETTPSGEKLLKEAADCKQNASKILETNSLLYSKVSASDALTNLPEFKPEPKPEMKPEPKVDPKPTDPKTDPKPTDPKATDPKTDPKPTDPKVDPKTTDPKKDPKSEAPPKVDPKAPAPKTEPTPAPKTEVPPMPKK